MRLGTPSLLPVVALAAACSAGSIYVRPDSKAPPLITDETTGRTFDDCAKAFGAATTDTVLTFSAGSFRCGPVLVALPDWLVVRGAGLGHTFLDAGDGSFSALRPGKYLRVQDLTFGGLGQVNGEETRVEIVRAGVATNRAALFGDKDHPVQGTVVVVHSVLTSHPGPRPDGDVLPRPLAISGNEKVSVVESVLVDVEQEFERFPAPGSYLFLAEAVRPAFERHEPAAAARSRASSRPNVACGNAKNPFVHCGDQDIESEDPVALAAVAVGGGAALSSVEAHLRAAAKGFTDRYRTVLDPNVRQVEVKWFDDTYAQLVENEAALSGKEAIGAITTIHAKELVDACGRPDVAMRAALERARAADRLLGTSVTGDACQAAIAPRFEGLATGCDSGWEWEKTLKSADDADQAMGPEAGQVRACKEKLRTRLGALGTPGGLATVYLREVNRALDLGAAAGSASDRASLDNLVAALPYIVTKSGREVASASPPSIVDRIVKLAQAPNAGDGRKLVEVTDACQLVAVSPGSKEMKAVGRAQLAEELPNAAFDDEPRIVAEVPVEATRDTLPAGISAGAVNVALAKKCDELAVQAYGAAVKRYVVEELQRLAVAGSFKAKVDAEIALFLALSLPDAKDLRHTARNVPPVAKALQALLADLTRSATALGGPVNTAAPQPGQIATSIIADSAFRPPPSWNMEEIGFVADVLSRAGIVDIDTCAFLLPQVPWHTGDKEGTIVGDVLLDEVPVRMRCRPDPRGFELGFFVDGTYDVKAKVIAAFERVLTGRLGTPTEQRTPGGVAAAWPAAARARTGFVYRKPPPNNAMFGYILVPLGSNWRTR